MAFNFFQSTSTIPDTVSQLELNNHPPVFPLNLKPIYFHSTPLTTKSHDNITLSPCKCWCLCEEFSSVSRSRNFSGKRCKYAGQSVRALPIRVITVGKKRSLGVQLVVDEYIGKLKYYCKVEDVQLRSNPKNTGDVKAQIKDEDMAVMNIISSDDWVVMLDENGLDIGSEQMAELMGDAGSTGTSRISFCIGGPYGHGPKLRERANISIKLSSMVLNHQIALLVLVEQLYRSWTILKGQNYHH